MDTEKMKAQIEADTVYFKKMLDELDKEGRFTDRMPNTWNEYDNESEFDDLVQFAESLQKPNALKFWGV